MIDQIQNDTNCSFPELEKLWKGTTKYRINNIQNSSSTTEIMNKWKNYALPLGYRLVSFYHNNSINTILGYFVPNFLFS